jgi:ubiquinone/menaquinone biosynthesis C-methylase UbiE
MIFLPGSGNQVSFFFSSTEVNSKKVVIIGPGTIEIAQKINLGEPSKIIIIVDDYDSLITTRYRLENSGEKNIEVRMMEYDNTDFRKESIDVVYAQASVSVPARNKITREIKKILTPDGIYCAGEIVMLKDNPPEFVQDIWQSSDILPLNISSADKYYEERGFEIIDKKDLSFTLKDFYRESEKLLANETKDLSEQEKSYHKKLLKKISHESNAYLKLGGDTYMGFMSLIMRKK